jgi:hypothetical protein
MPYLIGTGCEVVEMKRFTSPRYEGRHAHSPDMQILLARAHDNVALVKGNKWPELGLPPVVVQGIKVWVNPMVRVPGRKSSKHRVMCECPDCGAVLSAGRLFQHVCKNGRNI